MVLAGSLQVLPGREPAHAGPGVRPTGGPQAQRGSHGNRCRTAPGVAHRTSPGAEGEGFEPSNGFPSLVFKTSAIGHSATPPSAGRANATRHLKCLILHQWLAPSEFFARAHGF